MKKIYLLLLLVPFFANAQVTVVKDVQTQGIQPEQYDQRIWQNNEWNGKFYYGVAGGKLVVTDGTDAGTVVVKDLGNANASIYAIIPAQDFFYFQVNIMQFSPSFSSGVQLWKSNGTEAGTVLLKDFGMANLGVISIDLGSDETQYFNHSILGNEMYFQGYAPDTGKELWKTDGTTAGTVLVKDINAGTGHSNADGFTRLGNFVYFFAQENYTKKLWKTDGTETGTTVIDVPNMYVNTNGMTTYNNKLIFMGYDETNFVEPWVSDGTVAGTHIITNTNNSTSNSYIIKTFNLKTVSNGVIFTQNHNNQNNLNTLWITDGTEAGTIQLSPHDVINSGNFNYVDYSIDNNQLLVYNGVAKTIVKSNYIPDSFHIITLPANHNATNMFRFQNTTWFKGGYIETEPWRTDGINAVQTLNINTNNNGISNPYGFFEKDNFLYFFANNGSGVKLYRYSGDYTFNSSVSTTWNVPNNWNSGVIPMASDDVTIPSGTTVDVDNDAFAKNISVASPINLVNGNLNINGQLSLNVSKITLNDNNLNLLGNSSSIIGNNENAYIITNGTGNISVENLDASKGTVSLPIGTSTNYNPLEISNTGTSDTFSARVSDGIANTTNGAVNTTWDISEGVEGGSDVSLTFSWNETQENGIFNRNDAKVGHYQNDIWNEETSGTVSGSNPYAITATGITNFSPFGVMNFSEMSNEDFTKQEISLYPNPAKDVLNFSEMLDKVEVYTLDGKKVLSANNVDQIDVNKLSEGIYLIQAQTEEDKKINSKFIKE